MKLKYDKDYSVSKMSESKFLAFFWNPISAKQENVKVCKTEELANKEYANHQFLFYSKNAFLLPKGVSINRRNEGFKYAITIGGKTHFNKNFDTVQKCLKYRDSILSAII